MEHKLMIVNKENTVWIAEKEYLKRINYEKDGLEKRLEQLLNEGKVFSMTLTDPNGRIGGTTFVGRLETFQALKYMLQKELNKIPKWIRKIYKLNTSHLK